MKPKPAGAPRNWQEAAERLKAHKSKKKPSSGLYDRLGAIEQMLKEKK